MAVFDLDFDYCIEFKKSNLEYKNALGYCLGKLFESTESFTGNKLTFYKKFLEKYYLLPKFESYVT